MEGKLLSREDEARGDAAVLCAAPANGRDQQHLLPDAEDDGARELGRHGARGLSLRDQGLAAHHAHGAYQARVFRRVARLSLQESRGTWAQARDGALPAAAESQEGPAPPQRISRPPPQW